MIQCAVCTKKHCFQFTIAEDAFYTVVIDLLNSYYIWTTIMQTGHPQQLDCNVLDLCS